MANCVAWVSYAYVKQNIFVFLANEPGILAGLFFTLSAYGVSNPKVTLVCHSLSLYAGRY